jgi:hypothetical protein
MNTRASCGRFALALGLVLLVAGCGDKVASSTSTSPVASAAATPRASETAPVPQANTTTAKQLPGAFHTDMATDLSALLQLKVRFIRSLVVNSGNGLP